MNDTMRNFKGKVNTEKLLAPMALVLLLLFFSIYSSSLGVSFQSFLFNIFESVYFIGFMALGMTFIIITGGIDLSIGTVMMCSAMFGGVAYNIWGWGIFPSLLLVVLTGTLFGVLNGFLVSRLELPAFIATLGAMMMAQGIGSIVSKVQTMRYPTTAVADGWFKKLFYRIAGDPGIPTGLFWLILFSIIAWFILHMTRFGKYTFAMGSNQEATRLSGINTKRWLWKVYILNGFFGGFAGIFYAATYTTIIPGSGTGYEMQAIAGVVIGGTSLAGGTGSIVGTIIGVFIMATLRTGLMAIGLQQQWQLFFTGVVVVLSVLLDIQRQKSALKA